MNASAPQSKRADWARYGAWVLVWLGTLLGWAQIAREQSLQWQRMPEQAIERYVDDGVDSPIPVRPSRAVLLSLCARQPGWLERLDSRRLNAFLEACLTKGGSLVQGASLEGAITTFHAAIEAQRGADRQWLTARASQVEDVRARVAHDLAVVRTTPTRLPALLAGLGQLGHGSAPRDPRVEALPATLTAPPGVQDTLAAALHTLDLRLSQPSPSTAPGQQAVQLGLLAAGLRWAPARAAGEAQRLVDDPSSVPAVLDRQRRASHSFRATRFSDLRDAVTGVATGAWLIMIWLTVRRRRSPALALCWSAMTLLAATGCLVLTDVAMTGDPALRNIATRQWLAPFSQTRDLPLLVQIPGICGLSIPIWWPLLVVGSLAGLLAFVGRRRSLGAKGPRVPKRVGQDWLTWTTAILAAGVVLLVVLQRGLSGSVIEILVAVACAGLAVQASAQLPLTQAGIAPTVRSWLLGAWCVGLAIAETLARGDLGGALILLTVLAFAAWLFGWVWWRWGIASMVAAITLWVVVVSSAHGTDGWAGQAVAWLPSHAQARVRAMLDPFHAVTSDLARVHWLMRSAGDAGWGLSYVPWQGLAARHSGVGLPLQGPSDYLLALVVAIWGPATGLLLLAASLFVAVGISALGLQAALRPGATRLVRVLGIFGGLGWISIAAQALLSTGGVAASLPLTGVPVALLGYGPATNAVALLYAMAVLGSACAVDGSEGAQQPRLARGVLRRLSGRWVTLGTGVALGACCLWAAAAYKLRSPESLNTQHVPEERIALAQALVAALQATGADDSPGANCPAFGEAVARLNRLLQSEPGGLQVGSKHLAEGLALPGDDRRCRQAASRLEAITARDLDHWVGGGVRASDYATLDPWRLIPGCVRMLSAGTTRSAHCDFSDSQNLQSVFGAAPLPRGLSTLASAAVNRPDHLDEINHHAMARGPTVNVTIDVQAQAYAQTVADCFVGKLRGEGCGVVPGMTSRSSVASGMRAAALGVVLAEVDSGRVLALAGAVSDCATQQFARRAVPDAEGRWPAIHGASGCAQWPDRRSGWAEALDPVFWPVPPGSALKPWSLIAGIDAKLVREPTDADWKRILAQSREQAPIQRLALSAGQRYLDVLGAALERCEPRDLLGIAPGWNARRCEGWPGLAPAQMAPSQVERIRALKEKGVDVDRQFGVSVIQQYLVARRLEDASIGGGDLRVNAVGLLDAWRSIDARARGREQLATLHVLEAEGHGQTLRPVDWMSPQAARRVLFMTAGVTSDAWRGTGSGACRVVFGACPAQGLEGFSGKTGTADFLVEEGGAFAKPGAEWPAKLFAGVFSAPDGRRYAIAAIALRAASGRTLDLESSAPAEASLALARRMGLHP